MKLELDDDAALVLLDLLAGYGEKDKGQQLEIRFAAERNALWALEGALENVLAAPFKKEYPALIAAARARLEQRMGPW